MRLREIYVYYPFILLFIPLLKLILQMTHFVLKLTIGYDDFSIRK